MQKAETITREAAAELFREAIASLGAKQDEQARALSRLLMHRISPSYLSNISRDFQPLPPEVCKWLGIRRVMRKLPRNHLGRCNLQVSHYVREVSNGQG